MSSGWSLGDLPGKWYKGNLHTHSTESDGRMAPETVVQWYRSQGYDFLSLTDHRVVTQVQSRDDFLCIPGVELNTPSVRERGIGLFHILGIGVSADCDNSVSESPQELIDAIRAAGGLAVLAHPHWSGNVVNEEFVQLEGYVGIECFNYACEVENHTGFGTIHWDGLLLHGKRVLGFATDDSHWQTNDSCGGWVMVKAPQLTQEAILAAIEAGHFYSSSGPEIYDLRFEDGQITVRCSPAKAVHFMTGGPLGRSVWSKDEDHLIREASYKVRGRERFVRVEVVDRFHRVAWTNPIYIVNGSRS